MPRTSGAPLLALAAAVTVLAAGLGLGALDGGTVPVDVPRDADSWTTRGPGTPSASPASAAPDVVPMSAVSLVVAPPPGGSRRAVPAT